MPTAIDPETGMEYEEEPGEARARYRAERVAKAQQLRGYGLSVEVVSYRMGVSVRTVYSWLRLAREQEVTCNEA